MAFFFLKFIFTVKILLTFSTDFNSWCFEWTLHYSLHKTTIIKQTQKGTSFFCFFSFFALCHFSISFSSFFILTLFSVSLLSFISLFSIILSPSLFFSLGSNRSLKQPAHEWRKKKVELNQFIFKIRLLTLLKSD